MQYNGPSIKHLCCDDCDVILFSDADIIVDSIHTNSIPAEKSTITFLLKLYEKNIKNIKKTSWREALLLKIKCHYQMF